MDQRERDTFLAQPLTAVISTLSASGRIHSVPVWYLYNDGTFLIITGRGSAKHRNIERSGRATLCVDQREGAVRYVTAEGPVTVSDPLSQEQRLALHTHYRGPEQAQRVIEKGGHEGMVLLTLNTEHWL
ncbi:MAG: TIGR03618 family F420-dependent PPOX class oxidoreductase [Tepidiformaceae bacterium]